MGKVIKATRMTLPALLTFEKYNRHDKSTNKHQATIFYELEYSTISGYIELVDCLFYALSSFRKV